MPQFDSHGSCFGCRAKCKGLDPCAQGADTTQCSACASLTEEQLSHVRENFAKRSAYRHKTGSQGYSFEEPETEPAPTGEDLSQVDDTLLDLEPEDSSTSAPLTGISPLTSLPALLPAQGVLATSFTMGPVQQSTTDSFQGAAPSVSDSHTGHSAVRIPTTHYSWQAISWKEWQLCHSHNLRGLSQQQRSHRLLGLNSSGASWSSRILR